MANFHMDFPDNFMKKLREVTGGDLFTRNEIQAKILIAGAEVVKDEVARRLPSVIGADTKTPSRSTGQLAKSLGISKVKAGRDGVWTVKVGFYGKRKSSNDTNGRIALILEKGKTGQPAKPFMKPAREASAAAALAAMEKAFDEEVAKLL